MLQKNNEILRKEANDVRDTERKLSRHFDSASFFEINTDKMSKVVSPFAFPLVLYANQYANSNKTFLAAI